MKKTVFIKNAAVLTVSGLVLRFIGILFKLWLAGAIGAEGIGLFQLVFSVYALASSFASSGIPTAVTRLCAEELALSGKRGTVHILKRCAAAVSVIALASSVVLLVFADFLAKTVLGAAECAAAIRTCSLSLPFMGFCSIFRGYFIARRKASPGAFAQIFEQAVRILTVVVALKFMLLRGPSAALAAVFAGDTVSEAAACALLYAVYKRDIKRLPDTGRKRPPFRVLTALKHIALPITAGRYLNSLLRAAENILVLKLLAKNPLLADNAVSLFGMIKGMALPILFFPSTLINSISTLLIPEMSEAAARGRRAVVKSTAEQITSLTLTVGIICGAVFFTCGDKIGPLLYKEEGVGYLLCMLSPIVPLMYLDGICDGILKGLDCQRFSFFVAIGDSALRLILMPLILPSFGVLGFMGIMYFSNFLTCFLNTIKLIRVSSAEINTLKAVVFPLFSALCSAFAAKALAGLVFSGSALVFTVTACALSILLYATTMLLSGCIKIDDIRGIL